MILHVLKRDTSFTKRYYFKEESSREPGSGCNFVCYAKGITLKKRIRSSEPGLQETYPSFIYESHDSIDELGSKINQNF